MANCHEGKHLTKMEIVPTLFKAITAGECGRVLLFTAGGRNVRHGVRLAHRGLVRGLSRLLKVVRVDFCKSLLWKSGKFC